MRKTTINNNIKILWPSVPGTAALLAGWGRGPGTVVLQVGRLTSMRWRGRGKEKSHFFSFFPSPSVSGHLSKHIQKTYLGIRLYTNIFIYDNKNFKNKILNDFWITLHQIEIIFEDWIIVWYDWYVSALTFLLFRWFRKESLEQWLHRWSGEKSLE